MAYQDASNVAITGGSIGGVGISGSTVDTTPIGSINPSTGAFTNLSSSGTVSGTGFNNLFASPPPLGSTTPNRVNTNALKTTGLTGYLYGHDNTGDVTASTTIPWSAITGAPSFLTPSYGAFHFDTNTALTVAIPNGSSTSAITVGSTTGFSTTGTILIDTELIGYTGITSTTFTGITRGLYATTASSHAIGAKVTAAQGTAANTRTPVYISVQDYSNNVSWSSSNPSRVTFGVAGYYNLQFSAQVSNASNTADNVTIWMLKNGTDIAESAGIITCPGSHGGVAGATVAGWNFFVQLAANDYIELYWTTDGGNSVLLSYPPGVSPTHPVSPAVIFTANQIA
jgi:hypothetical protein